MSKPATHRIRGQAGSGKGLKGCNGASAPPRRKREESEGNSSPALATPSTPAPALEAHPSPGLVAPPPSTPPAPNGTGARKGKTPPSPKTPPTPPAGRDGRAGRAGRVSEAPTPPVFKLRVAPPDEGELAALREWEAPTPPNNPTAQQSQQPNGLGEGAGVGSVGFVGPVGLLGPLGGGVEGFPVDALPLALQRFARSVAKALPCPVDSIGAMMLPVLGACIGRKRCALVKGVWKEYPLLWVAVVARSGDRKSPAFDAATAPLLVWQEELTSAFMDDLREWEALDPDERKDRPKPVKGQAFTTTATVEGIRKALLANPNGTLFAADELSGWVRALGQYKGGKGDDRQAWLSFWSGSPVVVNRASLPDPIVITGPFVALVGGIQPAALDDLIDEGREDGLSARLLFAYPDPLPPAEWTEDEPEGADDYLACCRWLWNAEAREEPHTFDPEAKREWVRWVNAHRKEEPPDHLRPAWSKAEGTCIRLALIVHLARRACGEVKADAIDAHSVRGAVKLASYFMSHARRAFHKAAEVADDGRVGKALKWVRKQAAKGKVVTARLAHMNGMCGVRTTDEARELLAALAEEGHGTTDEGEGGALVFLPNTPNNPTTQQPNTPEA